MCQKEVRNAHGLSVGQVNQYDIILSRVIVCHPQGTECWSECWKLFWVIHEWL